MMYAKLLMVLLLILAFVAVPVGTVQAQEDEGGGIVASLASAVRSALDWFLDLVHDAICRLRIAAFNAIGAYFCVECEFTEVGSGEIPPDDPPPGGGGGGACHDIEGCECSLCPSWLSDYKHHVSKAIGWIVGAGNVFRLFIPWTLWATLYAAYLQTAAFLWAVRLISKFGVAMFGAVS